MIVSFVLCDSQVERMILICAGLGAHGKVVFGVNFPRLAELKKKYDPKNVFSKGPSLQV